MEFLIYFILVVAHAWYDSTQIKRGILINHFRESVIFAVICTITGFTILAAEGVLFKHWAWLSILPLILLPLLTRAALFDLSLNLLVGKSWLYEGVQKPKSKESIIDRMERALGLPVWFYRIFYIIIYVTYLIIYYA